MFTENSRFPCLGNEFIGAKRHHPVVGEDAFHTRGRSPSMGEGSFSAKARHPSPDVVSWFIGDPDGHREPNFHFGNGSLRVQSGGPGVGRQGRVRGRCRFEMY